jgi:hypothetical protein
MSLNSLKVKFDRVINFLMTYCSVLFGGLFLLQSGFAQTVNPGTLKDPEALAMVSGMHTLSIHVQDTLTQDSVYQFMVQELKLPVYYTPILLDQRKYAGIYAGNMVLEPCGPYPDRNYATEKFRSVFYGMNFQMDNPAASSDSVLNHRGIRHQVNPGSIFITEDLLYNSNLFIALLEVSDPGIRDSLTTELMTDTENKPGIEFIRDIHIGFKEDADFRKWKDLLYPLEFVSKNVCQINDSLQIHFTKGNMNEVKGITFKVESLARAIKYLAENQLFITTTGNKIKLDPEQSFGLSIYFTDEQ